jgi:hypothetical protein
VELWRERALEVMPELRQLLESEEEIFSPNALWFELLPRVREAHRADDRVFLKRACGYAEWCRVQPDREIWNAVGVSFYEHLFDQPWMRPLAAPWLSEGAVADAWQLWEGRLPAAAMAEVRALLRDRRRRRR